MNSFARMAAHQLANGIRRLRRSTNGGVTVVFGVMAIALFAMIGLAVDLGRWVNARDHTVAAIDSAVLAAGRALQTGSTAKEAKAIAARYYTNAIASRISTRNDSITFEVVDKDLAVTATGTAMLKTPFMSLLGISELPLLRVAGSDSDPSGKGRDMPMARIAMDDDKHVETILMLDVSGSMQGQKLVDMKLAAKDLVNIVVWDNQSKSTSRVGLVPFSADVRPPADIMNKVAGPAQPFVRSTVYRGRAYNYYFAPTNCVGERGGNKAFGDSDPATGNKNYLTRVHNQVGSSWQSTANCSIHEDAEVLPLSAEKSDILSRIDKLVAQGGTAGHVGTAWAYYLLSPSWASVVKDGQKANSFGRKDTRKVAVLMSDGEYNYTYDADQGPSSGALGSGSSGTGSLNKKSSPAQAKLLCDSMKADGIEIFSVGFDLGGNQTAISTMNYCASSPDMFYNADDGEALKNAYRDIALRISKLYLSN